MELYYRIADLTVKMDTFGRTLTQAEPYRCQPVERPDICVEGYWEALRETAPHLSPDECEYINTGSDFYLQLLKHRGLVLHASAVVLDERAYLFTAPSGTGNPPIPNCGCVCSVNAPKFSMMTNRHYGKWMEPGMPMEHHGAEKMT